MAKYQDAIQRRKIASIAAAEALEEAIVTESIVRNLRYCPFIPDEMICVVLIFIMDLLLICLPCLLLLNHVSLL